MGLSWKSCSKKAYPLIFIASVMLYLFINETFRREKNLETEHSAKQYSGFGICREYKDYLFFKSPCSDSKLASDPLLSTVSLEGGSMFSLGSKIKLTVKLFNGYNEPKSVGGDYLRARMWNTALNAFSAGNVIDNYDGTYHVHFEALWKGHAFLEVELLYPREIISAVHRITNEESKGICKISPSIVTDLVQKHCFPKEKSRLIKRLVPKDIPCNFTAIAHGGKHFCYKQSNTTESCKDWLLKTRSCALLNHPLSNCERQLENRKRFNIGGHLNVTIISDIDGHHMIDIPNIACTRYNRTKLWLRNEPTGFMYNGTWFLRHCQGGKTAIEQCFQNKTLIFIGDSTLNGWKKYIFDLIPFNCIILKKGHPPRFQYQDWQDTLRCSSEQHNITFIWVTEAHRWHLVYALPTIDKRFKVITVAHCFLHAVKSPYEVYKNRMLSLRTYFELIHRMFLSVLFFIKLPHTHRPYDLELFETDQFVFNSDYVGFVYTCIISDVFEGMYSRVIVLDNKDATIASKNVQTHPGKLIIAGMVKQLMDYICSIPK